MYEINIALNGKHFFATHERSIRSFEDLVSMVKILKSKFPESEGYEISAYSIETTGKLLDKEYFQ